MAMDLSLTDIKSAMVTQKDPDDVLLSRIDIMATWAVDLEFVHI